MKNIQILALKHIFFSGIGGISVSALATMMLNFGKKVSGSDLHSSLITKKLENLGATIYINHSENNLQTDIELLVFSGAISKTNPELLQATKMGIPIMERAEFLGLVASMYKNVIAIGGTHGKTTTTAMIGEILVAGGFNPTIHVGGEVLAPYGNFRLGGNEWFVTEACEYKRSLEHIASKYCVITNVEKDHMDCYENYADLITTFKVYASKADNLFTKSDLYEEHFNELLCKSTVMGNGGWEARAVKEYSAGKYEFSVYYNGKKKGKCMLNVWGKYMVENALYAIMVCHSIGIGLDVIFKTLFEFKGIKRRNELMGHFCGVPVFADYGHHPTQVEKAISTFNKVFKKVLIVFQPHTYSRTLTLKDEFTNCFKQAHNLIIYATYPAREEEIIGGRAIDLFKYINYPTKKKFYANNKLQLKQLLEEKCENYTAILILGAGDMYDFLPEIIDLLP